MCGIVGFITPTACNAEDLAAGIEKMALKLVRRGPDDGGIWTDVENGLAFGHRRLSVIDLSPMGKQPMVSPSGRFVIVYNGEIYNYKTIARQLETRGYLWRGHSDTEVMLAGFEAWGMRKTLEKCNGMFALALWDREKKSLFLARDRMGQKPLYYGFNSQKFFFSSELKALHAHGSFQPEIDRNALTLLLRHSYIPTPYSIYKNIKKMEPGTFVEFSGTHLKEEVFPDPQVYWNISSIALDGIKNPVKCREDEIVDQLEEVLEKSVSRRMLSDVPIGAFLSGGIDSSLVVALMQKCCARPVKTYSIGFHEKNYNEADIAKKVARHLNTDHTEFYITPKQALEIIPLLPELFDEPFADSSQIPTYLVSKMTRTQVTVALSGDGGDEMFAGYNRHFWGRTIWEKIEPLPLWCRRFVSHLLKMFVPGTWDHFFDIFRLFLPEKFHQRDIGDKISKLSRIISATDRNDFFYLLTSLYESPTSIVQGGHEPKSFLNSPGSWPDISDFTLLMQYLDMKSYLCDDIMTKVDRASMGASLEARSPFLDPDVVAFSWRLPIDLKISRTQGKIILKKLLARSLPGSLIDRPKKGFNIPIDQWLRGPLKEWAEDLLNPVRLKKQDVFRAEPLQKMWKDHLSGRYNYQYHLWNILMYQAWADCYGH